MGCICMTIMCLNVNGNHAPPLPLAVEIVLVGLFYNFYGLFYIPLLFCLFSEPMEYICINRLLCMDFRKVSFFVILETHYLYSKHSLNFFCSSLKRCCRDRRL